MPQTSPITRQRPTIIAAKAAAALATAICLATAALLTACSSTPSGVGETNNPIYPVDLRQTRSIDVQVVRSTTRITLTNTTAENLPEGTLWINAWFSAPFPGLPIGQTLTLNLNNFKDRFGDSFRAGGFFSTREPDKLVQAQLQANDTLTGLVVVGQRD